ncbi:MAG TPA: hypothetical protein VN915_12180 [Elusimicrobiota bacterium]|nr:hypothetical protein [Elusimicrobiota bacterium]
MKTLLIVAALGAGLWWFMTRVKENAAVKAVAESPLQYTKSLQNDTVRAKAAVDAANTAIVQENQEAGKIEDAAK